MFKRGKTVAILSMILLNIIMVTSTQSHCDENGKRGGFGYIILEGNSMDIQELNTTLSRHGYSQFSNNIFGIGAGGHEIKNRFIFYDGYAVLYFPIYKHSTVGNMNYKTTLSGFYGLYNIGYVIYEKNNLKIFPLLGLGSGVMKMKIIEKRSFDDILDNPKGNSTIKHRI